MVPQVGEALARDTGPAGIQRPSRPSEMATASDNRCQCVSCSSGDSARTGPSTFRGPPPWVCSHPHLEIDAHRQSHPLARGDAWTEQQVAELGCQARSPAPASATDSPRLTSSAGNSVSTCFVPSWGHHCGCLAVLTADWADWTLPLPRGLGGPVSPV